MGRTVHLDYQRQEMLPLGLILDLTMRNQDITQTQVADTVGCHPSLVSKWVNGHKTMQPDDVARLALQDERFCLVLKTYCSRCPIRDAGQKIAMKRLIGFGGRSEECQESASNSLSLVK